MHPGLKKHLDEQRAQDLGAGVQVIRYESDASAEAGIRMMLERGWVVQDHAVRKKAYSALTGVFTGDQVHTVTYVAARQAAG